MEERERDYNRIGNEMKKRKSDCIDGCSRFFLVDISDKNPNSPSE